MHFLFLRNPHKLFSDYLKSFIAGGLFFFCSYAFHSIAQAAQPPDLLKKFYEQTKSSLELKPDDLQLKKDLIVICGFMQRWEEMIATYTEISRNLSQQEKSDLDLLILGLQSQKKMDFKLNPNGRPQVDLSVNYLACNPLVGLPVPIQDSVQKRMLKGWEYLNSQNLKEGIIEFEEAAKIHLNSLPFLYVGLFFHSAGYPDEAVYNLERAIYLAPPECIDPQLYLTLAYAYRNRGDLAMALRVLQDQLAARPKDGVFLYHLANFYLDAGATQDFINLTERIWTFDPVVFALLKNEYDKQKNF